MWTVSVVGRPVLEHAVFSTPEKSSPEPEAPRGREPEPKTARGRAAVVATAFAAAFPLAAAAPSSSPMNLSGCSSSMSFLCAFLTAAASGERKSVALHATNREAGANSTRLPRDSRLRSLQVLLHKWFGPAIPWIPLTPFSVMAVGATLKAGRYSSDANYISAVRVASRDCGLAEHPLLGHAVRKAIRPIERRVGQLKQTLPPSAAADGRAF